MFFQLHSQTPNKHQTNRQRYHITIHHTKQTQRKQPSNESQHLHSMSTPILHTLQRFLHSFTRELILYYSSALATPIHCEHGEHFQTLPQNTKTGSSDTRRHVNIVNGQEFELLTDRRIKTRQINLLSMAATNFCFSLLLVLIPSMT